MAGGRKGKNKGSIPHEEEPAPAPRRPPPTASARKEAAARREPPVVYVRRARGSTSTQQQPMWSEQVLEAAAPGLIPATLSEDFDTDYDNEQTHQQVEDQEEVEQEEDAGGAEVASSSYVGVVRRGPGGRFATQTGTVGSGSGTTAKKMKGKRAVDQWILTESARGGPQEVDLIPSFRGHIAMKLWEDIGARKVLKPYSKSTLLDRLRREWPLGASGRVDRLVRMSGLHHLQSCLPKSLDMPLLSAFIERWQPDTNSFHMPFGEMTIMLHDVEEILMLRTEGLVCRGGSDTDTVMMDLLFPLEKKDLMTKTSDGQPPIYDNGGLHLDRLVTMFRTVEEHEDEDIMAAREVRQAKAYLLVLIGASLFPDKSGNRIRRGFLSMFDNAELVKDYAWGAAVLAHLYRNLGVATRANVNGVGGCLMLLQCWIYEYFPMFAPIHRMKDSGPSTQQRIARSTLWRQRTNTVGRGTLDSIRDKLDDMTADDVNWCPYGRDRHRTYRMTLFEGVLHCLDIEEPYHPDRCLRQLGYVQQVPKRIIRPDEVSRSADGRNYQVKWLGNAWEEVWVRASMLSLEGYPQADPPSQCADGYLGYYLARTHPRIVKDDGTGQEGGYAVVDFGLLERQIGQRALRIAYSTSIEQPSADAAFDEWTRFFASIQHDAYSYYGVNQDPPPFPPPSWADQGYHSGHRRRRQDP